jgi:uncharacterized membrane protein YhaH (DUF805 family)
LSFSRRRATHLLSFVFMMATLLPHVAVTARRLHDTGRSGWWPLIGLIPLVGFVVLVIWMCQDSRSTGEA